jgi:glucan biosynthesis protein C
MDAVRGILMALGIVLHAANPYVPHLLWLVADPDKSPILALVVRIVHYFRMPGFFIVAGFFSAMGLSRASRAQFLQRRTVRLTLPLITTLLLLNLPQLWFMQWWIDTRCTGLADCAVRIKPGTWIAHLWFLVYLIGYTVLLALLWPLVARLLKALASTRSALHEATEILLLILIAGGMGVALAAAARVVPALYANAFGFLNAYDAFFYLVYFGAGVLAFRRGLTRENILFPTASGWIALAGGAIGVATVAAVADQLPGTAGKVAHVFADSAWSAVFALLAIWALARLFRRPSAALKELADASYTIYLLHHVCIIVFAAWLSTIELPTMLEFCADVVVTLTLCVLVHHYFVSRHRRVRLVFNGV